MDFEAIKNAILTFLEDSGVTMLRILLILVVGIIAIKIIMKVFRLIFKRTKIDKITLGFIFSIIKFVLNTLLIIVIIQSLGVPITGIIAVLSAAGLAVGLALQDSLSNLANGIIIITTKPFGEGEYIALDGVEGTIKSIKMLTTTICTSDNKLIVMPNSKIVKTAVTNYSDTPTRRITFDFPVAYESDIEKVKNCILDVMYSNGKVYTKPAPFVALKSFGESSITMFAYCWCDNEDNLETYYYVMENVFNEFRKRNVSIPFNQMEVRMRDEEVILPSNEKQLPKRIEKIRNNKKKETFTEIALKKISQIGKKKAKTTPKNKTENSKSEVKK